MVIFVAAMTVVGLSLPFQFSEISLPSISILV